jgi:outer membrane protein assembly factor BamB
MTTGTYTDISEVDVDPLQEYYGCYNLMEIPEHLRPIISEDDEIQDITKTDNIINSKESLEPLLGPPMDSAWPMYCHDARHTGRSPYNTASNTGHEKWFFKTENFCEGSAVIDKEGMVYFQSWGYFYALYPNGSLKWSYDADRKVQSPPAIDENGVLYIGTHHGHPDYLYAFNLDGTIKWKYPADDIYSAPVIGDDGTIYFADCDNWDIIALYPNGTKKWSYHTNSYTYASPTIGLDGTLYCGSHDGKMYALYPNNGTLKWKYGTGDWVARGACIGDDGTVYFGSWDSHLYAVYPDGTLKWKTEVSAVTTPVISNDGIIYVGNGHLTAIYSNNGTIKWKFVTPGPIRSGNPCISAEGIIYFATMEPGYLLAINPDGTERWRRYIGDKCLFAPIIDKDGTVYIGSSRDEWDGPGYDSVGFLHAFGELDPDAPLEPEIEGPTNGKAKTSYDYNFKAISPLNKDVYFYIDWGDEVFSGWQGPYNSGEEVVFSHSWRESGAYSIIVRVKDTDNHWGPWGTLTVTIPRDKSTDNMLLLRILERFPLLERLYYLFSYNA